MAESSIDSWTEYGVQTPSKKDKFTGSYGLSLGCQPLKVVQHVAHVRHALDMLRDGRILPQLIYDESRLNSERILVVWLSPNDWSGAGGYRYGNVAFELDWSRLTDGKRLYWVGVMDYRPPACRILITDQNRDGQLLPYRPADGDGPWWHDESHDIHFWNGRYCLELMLESTIPLDTVSSLKFVQHHPQRCSVDPSACPDRGDDAGRGAARLLAGACAHRLLDRQPSLWLNDDERPNKALKRAWGELSFRLTKGIRDWHGAVTRDDSAAAALARSVLASIGDRRKMDRRELVSLFRTADDVIEACAALIERGLDLPDRTLCRSDDSD